MPEFVNYTRSQLDFALEMLEKPIYTVVGQLSITAYRTKEPVRYSERTTGQELHLKPGDRWGDLFDCAWFHFTGAVPPAAAGQPVVLLLDVNGEMCVFDEQGNPVRGLTNVTSTYDYSLGGPGKRVLPLTASAAGGEAIDIWADAGCNDLFGNLVENGTVKEANIAILNETARALFYDFQVLLDFLKVLPEDAPRSRQIQRALNQASWAVPGPDGLRKAREILAPHLAKEGGSPDLQVSAIGHAHMDLGWLWPIRETKRKGARTFSTALANMDLYPDYIFGASQPQYFQWMKEDYPALYERIREKVAQGRIEPQGAMWVEADTNLIGSESMVRQVLYGKRFFRQEFGVNLDYLWLPDVFGYSAALPQVLKKAGVDIFFTQKLSWSLINPFPHQSFRWEGIDGTAILAHMFPEETYNSPALPRALHKIARNYKDSGVSDRTVMIFGIGDGGGGPGEEHIERLARLKNLSGLPPVRQETIANFIPGWKKDAPNFSSWVGELYLERHEGTLTSEARNKWFNRRMEQVLRESEFCAVINHSLTGEPYPVERLEAIWKEVLLYQFHDILPGSSIKRVYDESLARYRLMFAEVEGIIQAAYRQLAGRVNVSGLTRPAVAFNSLSWARQEWRKFAGAWQLVKVPACGYTACELGHAASELPTVSAAADCLENDLLRVKFEPSGAISSIWDKSAGREVLQAGSLSNQLAVYVDPGDAWDFPMDYANQAPRLFELTGARALVDGPTAVLEQTYRLGYSTLVQEIRLTAGSAVVEFSTRVNFLERAAMLRTSFPVQVHAEKSSCEIQFGHIQRPTHRNTSWDLAKDEVPAHKWVDLSQEDYGVALLNDSKYGHKIKNGTIDLNLLRSAPYPGPRLVADADVRPDQPHHAYVDQGEHTFRYGLYPHTGGLANGRVVQKAYEFNIPIRMVEPAQGASGTDAQQASWITVSHPDVILETIKQAEDSTDLILRFYHAQNASVQVKVQLDGLGPVGAVAEVDLMEENPVNLALTSGAVDLRFGPFEIRTLRISAG